SQRIGGFSEDLAGRLKSAGVEAEIRLTKPAEIVAEVRRAIVVKPDMIVIGGGDGTLNAAAPIFVGTDTALGILPLGTLNHFAKALHTIPLDLDGAVQTKPRFAWVFTVFATIAPILLVIYAYIVSIDSMVRAHIVVQGSERIVCLLAAILILR